MQKSTIALVVVIFVIVIGGLALMLSKPSEDTYPSPAISADDKPAPQIVHRETPAVIPSKQRASSVVENTPEEIAKKIGEIFKTVESEGGIFGASNILRKAAFDARPGIDANQGGKITREIQNLMSRVSKLTGEEDPDLLCDIVKQMAMLIDPTLPSKGKKCMDAVNMLVSLELGGEDVANLFNNALSGIVQSDDPSSQTSSQIQFNDLFKLLGD